MKEIYTLDCGFYSWATKYMKAYTSFEAVCQAYLQLLDELEKYGQVIFSEEETNEKIIAEIKENLFTTPAPSFFEGPCDITITKWEIAE